MSTTHAIITIDIVLDRHNCREVLRALLHGILFHRLFGTVKPQTFEVLDVTIPGVADPEIERLVTEKVDTLWRAMENGSHRRGQLSVTFSKKDQKKSWIGITYEEEVPWEQWLINTEIRQPTSEQERITFNENLASTLTKSLHTMITRTSSEQGRTAVPPITNPSISPFPMKIGVKAGGVEVG
ncbi:hypothetical protein HETIRDRAFT_153484 [Heterobasidion irregulare TC 32-1]|uniref:Autophagy-related protein 101 n=1 Tax=Heterobasidion irregulare (strain TC 32-1) TaxID=747525 RepID=W4KKQ8_HETIT|nr:uncharacterized protein HETIRDRAFT_153484 [Heterobasidion irregulare TC 32-1]ETW86407.1 hypothetical protein HETIRDRAFT_153484 [Heterobasidion irregulare TC 32-1]